VLLPPAARRLPHKVFGKATLVLVQSCKELLNVHDFGTHEK
jgi:hypothetical protein